MRDNGKGFEIMLNEARHLLRVRAWGCWDLEAARKFRHALREKAEDLDGNGQPWGALIDVADFSAQSPDVVNAIAAQMEETSAASGIKKLAYVARQMQENWPRSEQCRWHQSVDEALDWLRDNNRETPRGGQKYV